MILVDTSIWIDHLRQRDERLSSLLDQVTGDIGSLTADGAYDGEPVYRAVAERAEDMVLEPGVDVGEHGLGHLVLSAGKEVVEAALAEPGRGGDPRQARPLEAVAAEYLGEPRHRVGALGDEPGHQPALAG